MVLNGRQLACRALPEFNSINLYDRMTSAKLLLIYICLPVIMFSSCQSNGKKLPIYGSREAVSKMVNGQLTTDTVYQTIPNFSFLNQDSVSITNQQFDGKIYIADFFFTRCGTICPIMHRNMYDIYQQYKGNKELQFLSYTIDFKHDRPGILKTYAKKLGINDARWQFVWGTKDKVYSLAKNSYMSSAVVDDSAEGGFDHSGYLILVDKHRRIRGAYLGFDTVEVQQLKSDLKLLLTENENN
jgi:protein SCO1/2